MFVTAARYTYLHEEVWVLLLQISSYEDPEAENHPLQNQNHSNSTVLSVPVYKTRNTAATLLVYASPEEEALCHNDCKFVLLSG